MQANVPAEITDINYGGLEFRVNGTLIRLTFSPLAWVNRYWLEFDGFGLTMEYDKDVLTFLRAVNEGNREVLVLSKMISIMWHRYSRPAAHRLLEAYRRGKVDAAGFLRLVYLSLTHKQPRSARYSYEVIKELLPEAWRLFRSGEARRYIARLMDFDIRLIALGIRHNLEEWVIGVIISGIRMISEPYNHILRRSEEVRVSSLVEKMRKFVNEAFEAFRPLSHKYEFVCRLHDCDEYALYIGTWLRTKWGSSRRSYGSIVGDILPYIRRYGDELKEHVRGPIRDDFAEAVELTREIMDYEEIREARAISPRRLFRYEVGGSIKTREKEVAELALSTRRPRTVVMRSCENDEDPWEIDISYSGSPAVIEDVIEDVVRLYDLVEAKVSDVRDHNERIMSRIDQVVAPWRLLNAFK